MHGYSPIVRLSVDAPLRIALIAFYENNAEINAFIRSFRSELGPVADEVIMYERASDRIEDMAASFTELSDRTDEYGAVMIVTHGRGPHGDPTLGVASSQKAQRSPVDDLIEKWSFLEATAGTALADKLLFLAICKSGADLVISRLTRGRAQVLHVIAPTPGSDLDAIEGGYAMGAFVNFLLGLDRDVYTPDDLQDAMSHVRAQHPGVMCLWEYGDA